MKKFVFLSSLLIIDVSAGNFNYAVLTDQAYLPKIGLRIDSSYIRVNDSVDIFNVREDEIGSLEKYGNSIGNLSGFHIGGHYGLNRDNAIFFKYENTKLDYGGANLLNHRFEAFYRRNITEDKYKKIKSLSLDFGVVSNIGADIEIDNYNFLNSMIKKIAPTSGYSIEGNGTIIKNNVEANLYDESGKKVSPQVDISNMSSHSFYGKLLLGSQLNDHSIGNIYGSFGYSLIDSKIDVQPKDLIEKIAIPELNRDEFFTVAGASFITEWSKVILELDYSYTRIFRTEDLNYQKSSHELKMAVSTPLKNKVLVFVEGDVMFQQFNSSLPYLYNIYTQTQFDKKYGFAKLGLAYKF